MRRVGHTAHVMESRNAARVLLGRPEGKRTFGRPRHRLEDNIKMYLKEVRWEAVDWIHVPCDRYSWPALMNTIMQVLLSS